MKLMKRAAALIVCVSFILHGAGLAHSQCGEWDDRFGVLSGTNAVVHAVAVWDPDGSGPEPDQLVAGGNFTTANGVAVNHIAHWDGASWLPFGSGMNDEVWALTTWDPDGDGPIPAQLVAGGYFTDAGGVAANRIARWDGSSWHPFASGFDGPVWALTTWDPDGDGPLPEQLVAGGRFWVTGGEFVNHVARWDGSSWLPFGSGVSSNVCSLTAWDPDGDGPLSAQLVAGGMFSRAGVVQARYVARWDGADWHPFGSGTNDYVLAVTALDPDGCGPLPSEPVAAGHFWMSADATVNGVARWGGSLWQGFGSGMEYSVWALTKWDPDGAGPDLEQLVAGGDYLTAGGVTSNFIARWDGSHWQPFGSGVNGVVYALTAWDPDGEGPLPAQLVAGGDFTSAGGVSAGRIALWSTLAPEIIAQPADDSVSASAAITLAVTARNGQPTYQWRRDAEPLSNGPTGSGSIVSGAAAATLTIANAQPGDSGDYDCIVTNSCGEVVSDVAVVVVAPPPSCGGDANGDDVVNGADLSVLLFLFGQSVTPGTAADFNGDGAVNGADLSVLLFRFGSSC